MVHTTVGNWTLMVHGSAFLVDTQQSGPRGADKLFSVNWLMPMLTRDLGRQTITFRGMWSLEPATVTQRRYPELFQNGETAFGVPIVDGQHPHNFFMEASGRYELRLSERARVFVFGAPIGEPALGPTAYPHRASASENPVAVLGHHEQDSTHVSYSVITAGAAAGPIQLEASTFHGGEPGENRWAFGSGKPDSFSSRLTLGVNSRLTGQVSIGRLNHRESLEPGLATLRVTSSIHHDFRFAGGHMSSSLIWGRNKDVSPSNTHVFNAYTAESTVNFRGRNWAWTRIENVDREEQASRIQAYAFGYERDLPVGPSYLNIGLGAQASIYTTPPSLDPIYGEHPAGIAFFLHIRPRGNMAEHMQSMHQH